MSVTKDNAPKTLEEALKSATSAYEALAREREALAISREETIRWVKQSHVVSSNLLKLREAIVTACDHAIDALADNKKGIISEPELRIKLIDSLTDILQATEESGKVKEDD